MKTVKAAAVVLLFVLIPHQAPFAESARSATDEISASELVESEIRVESESPGSEEQPATELSSPGSEPIVAGAETPSPDANDPNRRSRRAVDTDGYSLSARSLR